MSYKDDEWPPGTILLEHLRTVTEDEKIVFQPRPSDDPNDPLNWEPRQKYWNFACVTFYTLMVFAFLDVSTPTWGPMNVELGFSFDILNDSFAVECGSLAIGALLLIPFAIKFGRRPIYILSTAVLFAIAIWSANMYTVTDLMLVTIFGCLVSSLSEVLVSMTVADIFFVHQRGLMNTIYIWTTYVGGNLAPLAAGYITESQGWRWTWWWCALFFGAAFVVYVFGYEETKFNRAAANLVPDPVENGMAQTTISNVESPTTSPTADAPLNPSAKNRETEDAIRQRRHINTTIKRKSYWNRLSMTTTSPGNLDLFVRHSYQPILILFTIPAVGYMSLAYGMMLAWQIIMTVTLSSTMLGPPWNFSAYQIGLMSLATFIGSTIGSIVCAVFSDRIILWLSRRNRGIFEPEMRLWIMVPFAPLLPLGAFVFGYGLKDGWSWQIIALGRIISCIGSAPVSILSITYIMDCYTDIIGDALVGLTFVRNILSTIFVFALSPWIERVGMENVYITINSIGIGIFLFLGLFVWKGKRFRSLTARRYRWFASRQFNSRNV